MITSVARDDLPDGGAYVFRQTILAVKAGLPGASVEVLVPDFAGNDEGVRVVAGAKPDVFGHNLETAPRLYGEARPGAEYDRSLHVLFRAAQLGALTKTSLILGLGETDEEILAAMRDARRVGVSILHLGQYLQPARELLPVARFLPPEEFEALGRTAREMGFAVSSGPMVRASHKAQLTYQQAVRQRTVS